MTDAAASPRPDKPFRYLARHDAYADDKLRGILARVHTIAVVGASSLWRRPSYFAMKYLSRKGYRMIPVNPTRSGEEVLGEPVCASLAEVPAAIDMVQLFRASDTAWETTQETIRHMTDKGIGVLWMQLTVRDDAAAEAAEAAGLEVVMDRCPKIEFARLAGELGWSGINTGLITAKVLKPPRA